MKDYDTRSRSLVADRQATRSGCASSEGCGLDTHDALTGERGRDIGLVLMDTGLGLRAECSGAVREVSGEGEVPVVFLADYVRAGIIVHSADGRIVFSNREAQRILGKCEPDLDGKPTSDPAWRFLRGDGSPLPEDEFPATVVLESKLPVHDQVVGVERTASKDLVWALVNGYPVFLPDGSVQHAVVTFVDITGRKQMEDTQLFLAHCGWPATGEDFFESLARHLAGVLGMDFVCIDRLVGDGLTARTLTVYFEGKFEDNVEYALKDTPCGMVVGRDVCSYARGVRHQFPKDIVLQDMGAESYVGVTLWDSKGCPIGLIAVIGRRQMEDVRLAESILKLVAIRAAGELERKSAEEALAASVCEKATLHRELQHRVKNTLMMITSLIHVERRERGGLDVKEALEKLEMRVASLSKLYDILYEGGADDIRLDLYVRSICDYVADAFTVGGAVAVTAELQEAVIDQKRAASVGLILNETLTNAFKYAFPKGRSGSVRVGLSRGESGFTLSVRDDGAGPPMGFDPAHPTRFGIMLVNMLSQQLGGAVRWDLESGTCFVIQFPL